MSAVLRSPRLRPALLLATLGWLLAGSRPASALELPELAALAKPSVVLLTISDAKDAKAALGTGFFVTSGGRIVTNHHVIEGAVKVTATMPDGRLVPVVGILADDPARDIAVLQAAPGEYAPLTLGASTTLRMGDEIAIVGSPLGLSGSLSAGIVSALRESGPPSTFDEPKDEKFASWGIQVTAAVSPGSSGSPIMNRKGDVVAVAVGRYAGGEGLNFGVPIEIPESILAALPAGASPRPFSGHVPSVVARNLEISGAVFGLPLLGYLAIAAWRKRGLRRKLAAGSGRVRPS